MKVYNLAKDRAVYGWRAFHWPEVGWAATFVAKATFQLSDPTQPLEGKPLTLRGLKRIEGDAQGENSYPGDFAAFKDRGEVMVCGATARAPASGQTGFEVRLQAGPIEKRLFISGAREWSRKLFGSAITEPAPVETLPLQWRFAYGGPEFPLNPVGVGFDKHDQWLPQIEPSDEKPVSRPGQKRQPGGFGPLRPDWQPRRARQGRFDKGWLTTRWPWFPDDMDVRFFCEAPDDQQLEGYWRGDEALTVENLHPKQALLRSELPGVRARLFFNRDEKPFERFELEELKLNLDTVLILPEEDQLVLLWRATRQVNSPKRPGFERTLFVLEPIELPATTEDYAGRWLELIEERESWLKPRDAPPPGTPAPELLEFPEPNLPLMSKVIKEVGSIVPEDIKDPHASKEPRPLPPGLEHAKEPQAPEETAVSDATGKMIGSLVDGHAKMNELAKEDRAERKKAEQLRNEEKELKLIKKGLVPASEQGKPPRLAPGEKASREKVAQLLEEGRSLAGLKLNGLDLRHLNFTGADLRATMLNESDLSGCDLSDSKLIGTSLLKTKLADANLSGADVTGVDFTQCDLKGVKTANWTATSAVLGNQDFSGAVLEGWDAHSLDASGADFSGATLRYGTFTWAKFQKCAGELSVWERCSLDSVKMAAATLSEATFTECSVANLRARGATLERTQWTRCTGASPIFSKSKLKEAVFVRGSFPKLIADETELDAVQFDFCDISGAVFDDVVATKGKWRGCNLKRASFWRADLNECLFHGCNLYRAGFLNANLRLCVWPGSDIRQTALANFVRDKAPVGAIVEVVPPHGN